LDNFSRHLCG